MSSITLDKMEQAIVKKVASLRYSNNRTAGVHNAKMGQQSNEITDIDGFGAELAFCKLCNLYPDFSIEVRKGGYDTLLNGNRIDVKQTSYQTGRLLAAIHKKEDATDIYALMIGALPTYRFAGWAYSKDLINPNSITNLGHGQTYALSQDVLNKSLDELMGLSKPEESCEASVDSWLL